MIVVKLMGGLGNQMFQYAFARKIALTHQAELRVDLSFLYSTDPSFTHSKRDYELDVFNLKVGFATREEVLLFLKNKDKHFYNCIKKIVPFIFQYNYEREINPCFNNDALHFNDNSYLDGYWQSEKYFNDIRPILLEDFTFRNEPTNQNRNLLTKIDTVNSVSIHVRRGDYVSNTGANKFHGLCGLEYYQKAVSLINSKQSSIELFIFSDDIKWCKNNFKFDFPATYIDNNSGKLAYEDMRLMTACKHNIIANSSFSWWAAWLNKNLSKMVAAPANWFHDQTINTDDLIPSTWIRI